MRLFCCPEFACRLVRLRQACMRQLACEKLTDMEIYPKYIFFCMGFCFLGNNECQSSYAHNEASIRQEESHLDSMNVVVFVVMVLPWSWSESICGEHNDIWTWQHMKISPNKAHDMLLLEQIIVTKLSCTLLLACLMEEGGLSSSQCNAITVHNYWQWSVMKPSRNTSK